MTRTALNTASRSAVTMIVTALIAGCSSMGEEVFTRQNQASSALATMVMEAEMKDPGKADLLYKAEADLHDACAPIRDAAARQMTGEPVGFDSKLVVFISLDRCATETQRVEEFIRLDSPSVARFYLGSENAEEVGSKGPAHVATSARDTVLQMAPK
jgi:hypothetical protein